MDTVVRDPRGGHNRKKVNENFFKTWSPKMAYVLGLLLADGAFEDVRKSSRTCYIQLTSTDRSLIEQVRDSLASDHTIASEKAETNWIRGRAVNSSENFRLRIGNKVMYQDLVTLGIAPKKAKRIHIPSMPEQHFKFFVRGYFDGDGCVNIYKPKNRRNHRLSVIFTSCSDSFLRGISEKLSKILNINAAAIHFQYFAFRLQYRGQVAIKILSLIYDQLNESPYLERKYQKYQNYLSLASN